MAQSKNYCYDKAKYHDDYVRKQKLSREHTYNHTTFFMSWLVKNNLMSDDFENPENNPLLKDYRLGKITINKIYEWWDCALCSDMLSPEGNAFAQAYFDFEKGMYIQDYKKHLQKDLPSELHVPYTKESEKIIHAVISKRYKEWKEGKK